MDARLQRRVQRYGWDRAAADYEPLWGTQLAEVHAALLSRARPAAGERVLDVACGTGLVSLAAARAVGARGEVLGVDLSDAMVESARQHAQRCGLPQARFERMDAEQLALPDATHDVVLCVLGLMYMPEPERALRELRRVLRPGGRFALAVWGERALCGWASVFPIVDAEVASEVCPLFFRLGQGGALARACRDAGLADVHEQRLATVLDYGNPEAACDAALVGGPVALAWSRFDAGTRQRVRRRYLDSLSAWRHGPGYRIPGEFLIVAGCAPAAPAGGGGFRPAAPPGTASAPGPTG